MFYFNTVFILFLSFILVATLTSVFCKLCAPKIIVVLTGALCIILFVVVGILSIKGLTDILKGSMYVEDYTRLNTQLQQIISDGNIDLTEETVVTDIIEYNNQVKNLYEDISNGVWYTKIAPEELNSVKLIELDKYIKRTDGVDFTVIQTEVVTETTAQ